MVCKVFIILNTDEITAHIYIYIYIYIYILKHDYILRENIGEEKILCIRKKKRI